MLLQANSLHIPLADKSVSCVVTSPPYWKLRRYGAGEHELGGEATPAEYVANLVAVFREVRRVLRDDGVLWLNIGDTMAGSGGAHADHHANAGLSKSAERGGVSHMPHYGQDGRPGLYLAPGGLQPGDMVGIPWRVAFALQADGWLLRSEVIWHKRAPMPESVAGTRWEQHRVKAAPSPVWKQGDPGQTAGWVGGPCTGHQAEWVDCPGCPDCEPNGGLVLRRGSWRPTKSHEQVFMFAKTPNYYADGEAVREQHAPASIERARYDRSADKTNKGRPTGRDRDDGGTEFASGLNALPYTLHEGGRNLRDVWTLSPEGFKGAHYATFPSELPRLCIEAATSAKGVCPVCGKPWARILDVSGGSIGHSWNDHQEDEYVGQRAENAAKGGNGYKRESLGWRATCGCNAGDPVPAVVLDPFAGSGTTVYVAQGLGRRGIGLDLSLPYLQMAVRRSPMTMTA